MLNIVKSESRKKGMNLNSKKTKGDGNIVKIKKAPPECNTFLDSIKVNIWALSSNETAEVTLKKFNKCAGKLNISKDEKSIHK